MKFGSSRLMPGLPKVTTVCGTSSVIESALRRLRRDDVGHRCQAGLGGQVAERLVEQLAERRGIDIADHGDAQRVLGDDAALVGLDVIDGDRRHAVSVPLDGRP